VVDNPIMRIIAGEFGGRRLKAPKGRNTRPTPDRVREALFSVLGEKVDGARVVELFGGTGSLGLESISRGAARAVFFEIHSGALSALRDNISALALEDRTEIHRRSVLDLPRVLRDADPFHLVFCDPPHRVLDSASGRRRVEQLLSAVPLAPDATVILEHRAGALGDLSPAALDLETIRTWGSTGIAFYRPRI